MKQFDVIALGELLIDFTESGVSAQGNRLLEVNPGGAPCNVLAMLQKLGRNTAFIGKVGDDLFGRMLEQRITGLGINGDSLVFDHEVNTTLTFVETKEDGDREFSFYRNPGADMMLSPRDVRPGIIGKAELFHFGTLSLTHEGCREATRFAVEEAENAGLILTFDPNLRLPLWDSAERARQQISYGLSVCHAVKIADNELEFMTGTRDIDRAVQEIRRMYPGIKLLCATLGKEGCKVFYEDKELYTPGFIQEHTIETTGAGDTFCACMIDWILRYGIDGLTESALKEMSVFANAAASLITTRKGALGVMPSKEEVLHFLAGI